MKFRTDSADETRALGGRARRAPATPATSWCSSVISARARRRSRKALARGLGVEGPVTSPSFTLVQEYAGRLPVAHVDVYRLERIQELHDLGFEELVDGAGVTIVEWGDAVAQVLPPDRVVVQHRAPARPTTSARSTCRVPTARGGAARRCLEHALEHAASASDGEPVA